MTNKWHSENKFCTSNCKCKINRGMTNHPSTYKAKEHGAPEAFPVLLNTTSEELAVFLASNEFEMTTKGVLNHLVMVRLYRRNAETIFARPGDTIILYAKKIVVIPNTNLHSI